MCKSNNEYNVVVGSNINIIQNIYTIWNKYILLYIFLKCVVYTF